MTHLRWSGQSTTCMCLRPELYWGSPMTECSIDQCQNQAKYAETGWCQTHYHRWWRTGDPLGMKQARGATGADSLSWKGDDVSYHAAHARVRNARGSASQWPCEECDNPAAQWAYDHQDPNEKSATFGDRTIAYSTDVNRYRALCRGCHVKLDRVSGWPKRTECANGHAFDETNTRVTPTGERACRACARDRARSKRAELKAQGLSSRGRPLKQDVS